MQLLDHFHPPLSNQRHWEGCHSRWASAIVDQLNQELPTRYFAEPHVHRGSEFEIDVATFEGTATGTAEHSAATMVWSPPEAERSIPLPVGTFDTFEVRVINDEAGPRLVAAIELVSPSNKDRPESRRAFAVKCAAYLQESVSLVVVDVITSRLANLHHELLEVVNLSRDCDTPPLWAAAYRLKKNVESHALEIWWESLTLGQDLPTLPLWLNSFDAVPVDLAASYTATCLSLRIDGVH